VPELTPRQLLVSALAALAVLVLGAWYLSRGGTDAGAAAPPAAIHVEGDGEEDGSGAGIVVHVAGAVRDPGVYRLRPGARVDDAVGRAGGATSRADLSQVNLAAEVEDGRQVLVPERVSQAAAAAGGAAASTAPATPAVPLNLNTATIEQLDELDGIGPATAQQILDYREAHGGFGSVEELAHVPGIGDKRLASLREQVRV
jgi:competence protein ComEA